MTKKIIVIAGNKREFDYFINKTIVTNQDQFVYASSANAIRGIIASKVFLIGTYIHRKNLEEIKMVANSNVR